MAPLDMTHYHRRPWSIGALLLAMRRNRRLHTLDLSNAGIEAPREEAQYQALAQALPPSLHTLVVEDGRFPQPEELLRALFSRAAELPLLRSLDLSGLRADELLLTEPAEASLARHILRFPDVVREVEADLLPSKLCEYIYELSGKFNQFYESCPVMQADNQAQQRARFALCELSASLLSVSLGLLGIKPLERL